MSIIKKYSKIQQWWNEDTSKEQGSHGHGKAAEPNDAACECWKGPCSPPAHHWMVYSTFWTPDFLSVKMNIIITCLIRQNINLVDLYKITRTVSAT